MCVALMKDLRDDPLVRRGQRCTVAIEQAVEFGTTNYGDDFFVPVKPHPVDGDGHGPAVPAPRQKAPVVRAEEERNGGRPLARDAAEKATS